MVRRRVWLAGITQKAFIPSSFALSMETLPSSSPGMSNDRIGLTVRLPVMMPTSNDAGSRRRGMKSSPVASCNPAGPLMNENSESVPSLSTTSLP